MIRRALLALVVLASVAVPARMSAQTARRPTVCDTSCIGNWYYFDEDRAVGAVQDWNCGRPPPDGRPSSYDGHRGTDFSLTGGNAQIDVGHDIVAVADGVVRTAEDGHFDHCSTCDPAVDARCGRAYGGGFANHVAIDHGGFRAWYGHMRTGSVRVAVGDRVTCGQVIGQIGSSGCTTGAHLHFEPRPPTGDYTTAFDPFSGPCSSSATSLWTEQGAYRDVPGAACNGGATDADGDGAAADVDCDDADASIHPGATEVCGDGVDQDCAGGDAACPMIDLGMPEQDASTPIPVDGSIRPLDGGALPPMDGAIPGGHLLVEGGCGCRVAPLGHGGSGAAWLALGGTLCLLGRRRRPSAP